MMQWKLNAAETAGVVGVGVGLGLLAKWATEQPRESNARAIATVAGGAAIYTAGVVIGANRPKSGWEIPKIGSSKRR